MIKSRLVAYLMTVGGGLVVAWSACYFLILCFLTGVTGKVRVALPQMGGAGNLTLRAAAAVLGLVVFRLGCVRLARRKPAAPGTASEPGTPPAA